VDDLGRLVVYCRHHLVCCLLYMLYFMQRQKKNNFITDRKSFGGSWLLLQDGSGDSLSLVKASEQHQTFVSMVN